MSYNSKYKGSEVEELLDSIGNKVDKVDGKQLSTEDFTTLLKQKLDGLSNYDDTEISQAIEQLRSDFDTLVSGDTTTAIKTFNEVIAFLDGLEDTEDLASIIASIEQQIAGKQDTLVSGTNIKTINGTSILGSGNIVIEGGSGEGGDYLPLTGGTITGDLTVNKKLYATEVLTDTIRCQSYKYCYLILDRYGFDYISYGGNISFYATGDGTKFLSDDGTYKEISGGSSSGGSGAYAEVNHGTSDTIFTLTPNTFHVWDEVETLDLSFGDEIEGVANEYLFQFTSGSTATTLTLPDTIKWSNGEFPTIEPNMIYQISILEDLGSVLSFSNS